MASFFSRNAMIRRYRQMATMISDERTRKTLLDVANEYEQMEAAEASFPAIKRGSQQVVELQLIASCENSERLVLTP